MKKNEEMPEIEISVKDIVTTIFVILAIPIGIIYWIFFTGDDEPEPQLTTEEIHKRNIEKAFSPWDGAHINLEKHIINSLNDPESYKHIKTVYYENNDTLIVSTEFTARNGFGGTIKKQVIVSADTLGNIIDIIQWID